MSLSTPRPGPCLSCWCRAGWGRALVQRLLRSFAAICSGVMTTVASGSWASPASLVSVVVSLLVRVSSLGDVLHNLPMVADILRHHPDAQIDWVVEEGYVSRAARAAATTCRSPGSTVSWSVDAS